MLAVSICSLCGAQNNVYAQGEQVGEYGYTPADEGTYRDYMPGAPQVYSMPMKPTRGVDAPYTHMVRDNYSGDSRLDAPYVRMHADAYGGKSLSTPWIHIDNWGGGLHLRSPYFRKDIN